LEAKDFLNFINYASNNPFNQKVRESFRIEDYEKALKKN